MKNHSHEKNVLQKKHLSLMKKVAYAYINKIKKNQEVKGIALVGSVVHGNVQKDSDIDIIFFYEKPKQPPFSEFKKDHSGISIHIINESLSDPKQELIPLLLTTTFDWSGVKNHYASLKPVWDPDGEVRKKKAVLAKIYPEERIYVLSKYLFTAYWNIEKVIHEKCGYTLRKQSNMISSIKYIMQSLYLINNLSPPPDRSLSGEYNLSLLKKKPPEIMKIMEALENKGTINPKTVRMAVEKTIALARHVIAKDAGSAGLKFPYALSKLGGNEMQGISQIIEQDLSTAWLNRLDLIKLNILRKKGLLNYYYKLIADKLLDQFSDVIDWSAFKNTLDITSEIEKIGWSIDERKRLRYFKHKFIECFFENSMCNCDYNAASINKFLTILRKNKGHVSDLPPSLIKQLYNTINFLLFIKIPQKARGKNRVLLEKKLLSVLRRLTRNKKFSSVCGLSKAEITNVSLKKKIFMTGSEFEARINYNAKTKIKKPMFGIAIHSEDGAYLIGPNTTDTDNMLPSIEGKGSVIFRIKNLPLLSGRYFLSVTLMNYRGTKFYSNKWKEISFIVLNGKEKGEYGLIKTENEWEYKRDADKKIKRMPCLR